MEERSGFRVMPNSWFVEVDEPSLQLIEAKKGLYSMQVHQHPQADRVYLFFLVGGYVVRRFGMFFREARNMRAILENLADVFVSGFPDQPENTPHPIMRFELESDPAVRWEASEYEERIQRLSNNAYSARNLFASTIYDDIGKDTPAFYEFINGDDFNVEFV